MSRIRFTGQTVPSAPPSGKVELYVDSADKIVKQIDENGLVSRLGAPDGAYIPNQLAIYQALGSQLQALGYGVGVEAITSHNVLVSQRLSFVAVYISKPTLITGVKWYQNIQGVYTASNFNGVGLYSYAAGTLTQIATSTNNGNIWKAASGGLRSQAFTGTLTVQPGIYFVAFVYSASAATTVPDLGIIGMMTASSMGMLDLASNLGFHMITTGVTALPSTQATSGTTQDTLWHWVGLY